MYDYNIISWNLILIKMSYKFYTRKSQFTAGTKIQLLCKFTNLTIPIEIIQEDRINYADQIEQCILQTPEGSINESDAIVRHLARKAGKFYGNTPAETASIDQWLEFYSTQINVYHPKILYGTLGYKNVTKNVYEAGKKDYIGVLCDIDKSLQKTLYLAGNELTIADLTLLPSIRMALRLFLDEQSRDQIVHVVQWYQRMFSHQEIADFFGRPWICAQETFPIFKHTQSKEPKEKGLKKKKQAKKKIMQQEYEQEVLTKKENPFDTLPQSTFSIADWKREFFTSEDRATTLHTLWEKFDIEGWSVWKVSYIKYEGQGAVNYLNSCIIAGQLRNLSDDFRKYCLGSYGVYEKEGNYQIDGFWLWRGTEIPSYWIQHPSYQYITFTKLSPKSKETQQMCAEYWLNDIYDDCCLGRNVYQVYWYK